MRDFRHEASRFSDLDNAALKSALLSMRTCPHCRGDLAPAMFYEDVWICRPCKESWHLPKEEKP